MFKKARENKKGFTLAELLIVVAIIAVLVAISIPIFTSQLEKSRDAVTISNIRAAYAEAASAYLTSNGAEVGKAADHVHVNAPAADGTVTVDIKDVVAKGQQDGFSNLDTELPFSSANISNMGNGKTNGATNQTFTLHFQYIQNSDAEPVVTCTGK